MKEIHLIPTDRPSRLHFDGKLFLSPNYQDSKTINSTVEGRNIYITSDEEIKEEDWFYNIISLKPEPFKACENGDGYVNCNKYSHYRIDCKKIILTTDQDLIKDGVQAITDEFLEWFVKNPSCEHVSVQKRYSEFTVEPFVGYKIIIPQEDKIDLAKLRTTQFSLEMATNAIQEAKQETLEEVAEKYSQGWGENDDVKSFIAGDEWQAKRMYSEEEVKNIAVDFFYYWWNAKGNNTEEGFDKWFEQFKKKELTFKSE
jgi:hypothetical protein